MLVYASCSVVGCIAIDRQHSDSLWSLQAVDEWKKLSDDQRKTFSDEYKANLGGASLMSLVLGDDVQNGLLEDADAAGVPSSLPATAESPEAGLDAGDDAMREGKAGKRKPKGEEASDEGQAGELDSSGDKHGKRSKKSR